MLYFEDFAPGDVRVIGSVEVDEAEVLAFARRYDPQPFHIDEAAAQQSHFGGLVASGWHTCAMIMRVMCDGYLLRSASMGSPGLELLRWKAPVRPGDTLTASVEVLEARVSASKPDRGLVRSRWTAVNQHGVEVVEMVSTGMFGRRPG